MLHRFTALWRRTLLPAVVGGAALLGAAALATHRPPVTPALGAIAAASLALVAVAVTECLASSAHAARRWPATLAIFLLLLGGLSWATAALDDGAARPVIPLVGSVLLAMAVLGALVGGQIPQRRLVNSGMFALYCAFTFYLAVRIGLPSQTAAAGSSVSIADTAFDVMVFTVIQTRFGDAGRSEGRDYAIEYVASRDEWLTPPTPPQAAMADSSRAATREVILLGVAVAVALLALLAEAAGPLGLDRRTNPLPADRWWGLGALVALTAIALLAERRFTRWRAREGEPPRTRLTLDLPAWYWVPPAVAGGIWLSAAIALANGPAHVPLLAGVSAGIVLVLSARSLVLTPIELQCRTATVGQLLLAGITALALAAAAYWLVAYGAWSGAEALRGEDLAPIVAGTLLGNLILFVLAGRALAWGLPSGRESEHVLARGNIMSYVAQDAAIYSTVFLIGVAIPLYAASRDAALEESSLSVVASLVFLPGLINAVVWGVHNWARVEREMQTLAHRIPRAVIDVEAGNWHAARDRETARKRLLLRHLRAQRIGVLSLLAVGLSYLGAVLIEH